MRLKEYDFSKKFKNLGFSLKNKCVFRKKALNFFKIAKGSKLALECASNGIIQKCLFRPNYEVFLTKNEKILNVGKTRKYDEKKCFFRGKNVLIF